MIPNMQVTERYGCNHVTLMMLFVHNGCRVDVAKEKQTGLWDVQGRRVTEVSTGHRGR